AVAASAVDAFQSADDGVAGDGAVRDGNARAVGGDRAAHGVASKAADVQLRSDSRAAVSAVRRIAKQRAAQQGGGEVRADEHPAAQRLAAAHGRYNVLRVLHRGSGVAGGRGVVGNGRAVDGDGAGPLGGDAAADGA